MSDLIHLPIIKSGSQFEQLCCDVLHVKCNVEPNLHGRLGQEQNGIDLFMTVPKETTNEIIGIQCKNYSDEKPQNKKKLLKEIEKVFNQIKSDNKLFLTQLWFMTTWPQDSSIQNKMICLQQQSNIQLKIMFWEDIEKILLENTELIKKYYPNLYSPEPNNYLSLLNLSFFGTQFAELIFQMLGNRGETDKYCDMLEEGKDWFHNEKKRERFLQYLAQIRNFVSGDISVDIIAGNYKQSNQYFWCKEIELMVNSLVDSLASEARPYYIIGHMLGRCCITVYESYTKDIYHLGRTWKNDFLLQCQKLPLTLDEQKIISDLCDLMYQNEKENELPTKKINAPSLIYDYIRERLLLQ